MKQAHHARCVLCLLLLLCRSCFGELALLYSEPRAATVRAVSGCKLWVMTRSVYNAVKRNFTDEQSSARHQLLDNVPALKHLSSHHKALLVDALKQVCMQADRHVACRQAFMCACLPCMCPCGKIRMALHAS